MHLASIDGEDDLLLFRDLDDILCDVSLTTTRGTIEYHILAHEKTEDDPFCTFGLKHRLWKEFRDRLALDFFLIVQGLDLTKA